MDEQYLNNATRGIWEINEKGKTYFKREFLKLDKKSLLRINRSSLFKER